MYTSVLLARVAFKIFLKEIGHNFSFGGLLIKGFMSCVQESKGKKADGIIPNCFKSLTILEEVRSVH